MNFRLVSRLIRAVRRGGKSPLLLFLGLFCLIVNVNAQVVFVGRLTQEKKVALGETYFIEFSLLNRTEKAVEVVLLKKDFLFSDEEFKVLKAGSLERSNAKWIEIKYERLLLGGRKRVELRIPVKVPDEVGLKGSHFSHLIVQTMLYDKMVRKDKRLRIGIEYAVNVITTIEGGKRAVEFENTLSSLWGYP